jgi:homoserine kinase
VIQSATAFAPGSVSNVACGFDIMGFALDGPGDCVTVRRTREPGVRIVKIRPDGRGLPVDPARNTAGAPVIAMLEASGAGTGLEIEIDKGLPIGSGIGSSAASAVAAAVACNEVLGTAFCMDELLRFAIEGERIASKATHVDNLAPCLWGGFVLVRGYDPIDVVRIPVPENLWCTVVCPSIEIRTEEARRLLPPAVPLRDVVAQTGNAAGLVAGLMKGDFGLISRSLHDRIAEPARSALIPGFAQMKLAALNAGSLGCSISGSGPAVFALSGSEDDARRAGTAMGDVVRAQRLEHQLFVSRISGDGARLLERKG